MGNVKEPSEQCEVIARWNGRTVLEGRASRNMAWAILKAFAENWVNPAKAGFVLPTYSQFYHWMPGTVLRFSGSDDGGSTVAGEVLVTFTE